MAPAAARYGEAARISATLIYVKAPLGSWALGGSGFPRTLEIFLLQEVELPAVRRFISLPSSAHSWLRVRSLETADVLLGAVRGYSVRTEAIAFPAKARRPVAPVECQRSMFAGLNVVPTTGAPSDEPAESDFGGFDIPETPQAPACVGTISAIGCAACTRP